MAEQSSFPERMVMAPGVAEILTLGCDLFGDMSPSG
jgi:hypothetical protein